MSKSINVIRKVVVKSVINDKLKEVLTLENEAGLQNLGMEFQRFGEHRERYIQECRQNDVKPDYEMMKKMAIEEERFKATKAQFEAKLDGIKGLTDGEEYVHGTVDSTVNVEVGSNWHALMTGVEVVLEDGIVKDIVHKDIKV